MNLDNFNQLINKSDHVVIVQADNPDGDSLTSSLALEAILSDMGKKVTMYCGVEVPGYLRYFEGWDRVVNQLPNKFDLSIIVDCAYIELFDSLNKSGEINWLKTKNCIVIDHHTSEPTIQFATVMLSQQAVSTGELIYKICEQNNWPVNTDTAEFLACSVLYDSLGLTSEAVSADTLNVMSKLVSAGANLAKIENNRRQSNKKSLNITKYKGELLKRITLACNGQLAYITIPWAEIETYSHEYNPSILVLDEMRMIKDVKLAIAFKSYPDGKVTAKIRANFGYDVADKLAESFGGGGHPYASGFKVNGSNGQTLEEIISKVINKTNELLQ